MDDSHKYNDRWKNMDMNTAYWQYAAHWSKFRDNTKVFTYYPWRESERANWRHAAKAFFILLLFSGSVILS